MMKKILIDANPSVPFLVSGSIYGIGRTNKELIEALNTISADSIPFKIELYTQNLKGVSAKRLSTHFKTHHAFVRNNYNGNRFVKALHIRELLCDYDIMHITHNYENVVNPEKCIVTIHDAMMFSHPEPFLGHEAARKDIPPFARKAKAIITCSENSKKEISHYMDVDPDKIFVIPWGVDHNILHPGEFKGNQYSGNKSYFISVSCNIGRKNTISVVKAYINFFKQKSEHDLILVWRNPSEEVLKLIENHPEVKDHIHFASNISNEELADLYRSASCTFFPSRYEGFGLPIAESMASGTPIVTCANSSLPEVGGDVAYYVDPDDIDAMSVYMEQFENGSLKKDSLMDANVRQSMKFTWENCARQTLEVYKKCLEI